MCENLHYESVYFKELHHDQQYYWPTIYRAGAAVVSTTPCIIKWHNSGIIISNIDNSVWFFWLEMRLRHHAHVNVVVYHISFQGYNRSEFVLSFHKTVNVRKKQLRNSKLISSSRNRRNDTPLACVASVSVWFRSKERPRNGISVLAAREMKQEPKTESGGRGRGRKETLADKPLVTWYQGEGMISG